MGFKVRIFHCLDCDISFDLLRQEEDGKDTEPETITCNHCEGTRLERRFTAPMVLVASYTDGTRRQGFSDLKESFRLESEAYNLPPSERGSILKEIDKVRSTK